MKIVVKHAKPTTKEEEQFRAEAKMDLESNQTFITIDGIQYIIAFGHPTSDNIYSDDGTAVPVA